MKTTLERALLFFRSKPFYKSLTVVGLLVPVALVPLLPRLASTMGETFVQLHVEEGYALPVAEVSGMALRRGGPNRDEREVFVVGDKTAALWRGTFEGGALRAKESYSLEKSMNFQLSECQLNRSIFCRRIREGLTAQWEGLATDETGRLWALQETTESIHVFSADMSRRETTIFLSDSTVRKQTSLAQPKVSDARDLFEGVVVLSQSAFLAAKQTKPASIIRYELATPLTGGHKERQVTATAVQTWTLPTEYRSCTLNELAQTNGATYLLSSNCKLILAVSFGPENTMRVKHVLRLPSVLKKPEALVALAHDRFLVGDDAAKAGTHNVFLLRPANKLVAFESGRTSAKN
jgi:hypothetical protein